MPSAMAILRNTSNVIDIISVLSPDSMPLPSKALPGLLYTSDFGPPLAGIFLRVALFTYLFFIPCPSFENNEI